MRIQRLMTLLGAAVSFGTPALSRKSFSNSFSKPFSNSFAKGCRPMDGQFYGKDKVGFFCFTDNVDYYDYKYST